MALVRDFCVLSPSAPAPHSAGTVFLFVAVYNVDGHALNRAMTPRA
jgi:hypothetical protein